MGRLYFSLFSAFMFIALFAGGTAEANGTLRLTFKHKDGNGVEQPLADAYVYLRDAAVAPPMERYFSPADYIYGPTNSSGYINVSVPEGEYFIRATGRNPSVTRPMGPPEPGDYSWTPIIPISITTNTLTDLGTQYAETFGKPPIRISGFIKSAYGSPISGKYVRAQVEPCILGNYEFEPPIVENRCGPVKLPAQQRTDANGAYTILIKDPGTYYFVVSHTLGHVRDYNTTTTGKAIGPYTVKAGDDIQLPDIVYTW